MKKKLVVLSLVLSLVLLLAGCQSWEKATFQTLSGFKAAVDQAVADYNSGKIPRTKANAELIEKARSLDKTSVQAFYLYAVAKVLGDPEKDLPAKKQAVAGAIAKVITLAKDIKALLDRFDPGWQKAELAKQRVIEAKWEAEAVRLSVERTPRYTDNLFEEPRLVTCCGEVTVGN
ncbi:MAG: hypothetical protein M3P27_02830 [Acidobacteriota bacterium]|nr:hypothetical protein [Acidobacteriota bacterium]